MATNLLMLLGGIHYLLPVTEAVHEQEEDEMRIIC